MTSWFELWIDGERVDRTSDTTQQSRDHLVESLDLYDGTSAVLYEVWGSITQRKLATFTRTASGWQEC